MPKFAKSKFNVKNLGLERNFQFLFSDVNFSLPSGSLLQITGVNGSGKSTLLRLLAGFNEPSAGTLTFQYTKVLMEPHRYQEYIHYMGHRNGLKPYLTLNENLNLFNSLFCQNNDEGMIDEVLTRVNLQKVKQKQIQLLSAGQQRRAAFAKLLLKELPLWILDEPTASLDKEGKQLVTNLLQNHLANNGVAIIATHEELEIDSPFIKLEMGNQHD